MPDVSAGALMIRLAVSLVVVVCLMLIAAKVLRRVSDRLPSVTGGSRSRTVTPIDVSVVRQITRAASVAVVRVAGREMILGVTDHEVTLLHSGIEPKAALEAAADTALGGGSTTTTTSTPQTPDAARIAASGHPRRPEPATPLSAWTDALESLRERTVRR